MADVDNIILIIISVNSSSSQPALCFEANKVLIVSLVTPIITQEFDNGNQYQGYGTKAGKWIVIIIGIKGIKRPCWSMTRGSKGFENPLCLIYSFDK